MKLGEASNFEQMHRLRSDPAALLCDLGVSASAFDGLQFAQAFFAYDLTSENFGVVHTAAEDACRLVFFQNDGVFVHEDFNGILAGKRKVLSDLDGENDPSEFIDASDDSSRFHMDNFLRKFVFI